MGERKKDALRVNFARKLKLEFHGVKVTSDADLLVYRELDNAFGLTNMVTSGLVDKRTGKNTQPSLLALLKQSVFSRLAGYDDKEMIKIDTKVVKHSRYVIFQMAEVMVSRSLFFDILDRIHRLKPVPIGSG